MPHHSQTRIQYRRSPAAAHGCSLRSAVRSTCSALLGLSVVSFGSPAVADPDMRIGAPEVPVVNVAPVSSPTATPTPVPCVNPTAEVAPGRCPDGSVHISSYYPLPWLEPRCIPNAPDFPTQPSSYLPDCSPNDKNSCAGCIWHPPTCQIISRVLYQSLDPSYANTAVFPSWNAIAVAGPGPACLNNLVSGAASSGWSGCMNLTQQNPLAMRYCDDFIRMSLSSLLGVDVTNPGNRMVCTGWGGGVHYTGSCTSGFVYLDQFCRTMSVSQVQQWGCGQAQISLISNLWGSSPISLEWSSGNPIENISSIVTFALEPGRSQWLLWRGSAETPLLVYDPAHTGRITSGAQLFGNWTFGGKRTASLVETGGARPWIDGFEALATLDVDHDGAITGEELAPLGLWFDRNQDGIAQAGEVVPTREANVTKLALGPTHSDPVNGLTIVEAGFERSENGHSTGGRSVDWLSKTSPSPSALLLDWVMRSSSSAAQPPAAAAPQAVPQVGPAAQSPATSNLTGPWEWTFESAGTPAAADPVKGFLVLHELANGKLDGASLVQIDLKAPEEHRLSAIRFALLEGSVSFLPDGRRSVHFTSAPSEHISTRSEAVLSADGQTLSGRTREIGSGNSGKSRVVEYRWKAVHARGAK